MDPNRSKMASIANQMIRTGLTLTVLVYLSKSDLKSAEAGLRFFNQVLDLRNRFWRFLLRFKEIRSNMATYGKQQTRG